MPVLIVPVLYILDRMTKNMAVAHLKNQPDIILIRRCLQLQYVENRGAAFGMLQNSRVFFIVVTVLILAGATYAYIRYMRRVQGSMAVMLLYSLLAAGALGNFVDRASHGYVVDFIYFSLINFPVFNVADIYITCGCILTVIYIIVSDRKHGI